MNDRMTSVVRVGMFRSPARFRNFSMDRYAESLAAALRERCGDFASIEEVRPSGGEAPGRSQRIPVASRLSDYAVRYPGYLTQARSARFAVNHIVDHAYGHLAYVLDPKRTVVTCHDIFPLLQWKGAIKIEQTKVVSDVDAEGSQLLWVHPNPAARLPYDEPLRGFDPNQPILVESIEYTLLVRKLGRLIATYEGLSLITEHHRYGPRVLAPLALDTEGRASPVLPAAPAPVAIEELRPRPRASITIEQLDASEESFVALAGGADGLAALTTYDFIGAPLSPYDSDVARAQKLRGLRALEAIAEIAIVAVPDINIQPLPPSRKAPLPPCIPNPCLPGGPPAIAPQREPATGDLPPTFSNNEIFEVQTLTYLRLRNLKLGMVINFGEKLVKDGIHRVVNGL